jgi:hypothetical protein
MISKTTFQKLISKCPTFLLSLHAFVHASLQDYNNFCFFTPLHNNLSEINKMATNSNDKEDDSMDSNDDELLEETIQDKVTKESFLSMVESASNGGAFLKIIPMIWSLTHRECCCKDN